MSTPEATNQPQAEQQQPVPSVSLPKGGGAIRGIGEKFTANPVTGTGSMSLPLAISPSRSDFAPQLSLSYDSGSGNGVFGFGWGLSLPSVTRKTEKGLPQYVDAEESDVFVLSGAEDLVPALTSDGARFEEDARDSDYVVRGYRPRVVGLFARIERWTRKSDGDVHWRSFSRDNVLTVYGKDSQSRIADADGQRIFSWLICESRDDRGNAVLYDYALEDGAGIDMTQAHEQNRGEPHDPRRGVNRYVKRIRYGNRRPLLDDAGMRPAFMTPDQIESASWMFEVVFDYDEGHYEDIALDPGRPKAEQRRLVHASPASTRPWASRPDPFSSYRAGFEVRTRRRCRRVLVFHHIPELAGREKGYEGLVRSTDFEYFDLEYRAPVAVDDEFTYRGSTRFGSFVRSVTQSGYALDDPQDGDHTPKYLKKSLPPLEFEYSRATIQHAVLELDANSLEGLPAGLDASIYRWVDLDGEGVSGVLTEQGRGWHYKSGLGDGRFGPPQTLASQPSLAASSEPQQLVDLSGDGQLDVVTLAGSVTGFYERDEKEGWESFRAFRQLPVVDWEDANLRYVDLDGDGRSDVLVIADDALTWHVSLGEDGFGEARRVPWSLDEERGPRLVFADGTQSMYLADMSGDGLSDLVSLRNGAACYWPSLGYGRFGAKVALDNAPWFDDPARFEQRRIRLVDVDGSGTTDIVYLAGDGVRVYLNQSGNRLSDACTLPPLPVDDVVSVAAVDFLGNGTACLVWSSPLAGDARAPVRYVDLMGGTKPHLLIRSVNNLGAETDVQYAPSTRFYLADKRAGRPRLTRLPFPVHVVERVVTNDLISGNRFVTCYAYHDGCFDGLEREFRGFRLVEQWDTEELAAPTETANMPAATNLDPASYVPPVHTKTWFHTGMCLDGGVSDMLAGLVATDRECEYYQEPGLTDTVAHALLLNDTVLPAGLTVEEEREACRALKGSMLRQEIYGLDGSNWQAHPYSVTVQSFAVRLLQRRLSNRHAVFFVHPRESLASHYERDPSDPRTGHTLTLEVDDFGNVLRSAAIGYGRRQADATLAPNDQAEQARIHVACTENRFTNEVDTPGDYRTPAPCETKTYELTGLARPPDAARFSFTEVSNAATTAAAIPYEQEPTEGAWEKRLLAQVRTYYRHNNLSGPALLGKLESLALPYERYKLAFTSGLAAQVYDGRVTDGMLADEARYVHTEGDADWWLPSGKVFYTPDSAATPAQELAYARQHFFLPHRFRGPFYSDAASTETFLGYDAFDLLVQETADALGNRVTVGERAADPKQPPLRLGHDYRVLQPALIMDANRNCSAVAFDALGLVAGTALMGKPAPGPAEGDSLTGFRADLTDEEVAQFLADPRGPRAAELLGAATTRIVHDLDAWGRNAAARQPPVTATIAREAHLSDLGPNEASRLQVGFSYSDGFGREIQKKVQAEPGPVPIRDADGRIVVDAAARPELTLTDAPERWVGTGWTVFDNKGKPVRQYEPFFTDTSRFDSDVRVGVSPVVFYDPLGRPVGTLHPNHTWEKVVFDPWREERWDAQDTAIIADPSTDPHLGGFFARLPATDYLPTWYALRTDPAHAAEAEALWPDPATRAAERRAAEQEPVHSGTPTIVHLDSLGRNVVTITHNRFVYGNFTPANPPIEERYRLGSVLDAQGNLREVIDAKGRVVVRNSYDLLGTCIHQASFEAGDRWSLNDAAGKPLYAWDSRDFTIRTAYDVLRRPTGSFLRQGNGAEVLVGVTTYGEDRPDPEVTNAREKVVELRDQAGVLTTEAYDFKGNSAREARRLAKAYDVTLDWSGAVPLEAETYRSSTRWDALNRPVQSVMPHGDRPDTTLNVVQSVYNDANLLEQALVWLGRAATPAGLLDPATADLPAVTGVVYDAKGQRTTIDYGNGATTEYRYDPFTFRLVGRLTRRGAAFPHDCPHPAPAGWPGCQIQNISYAYDAGGNVTAVRDDAQQTIFFRNKRVAPSAAYIYDAIGRLVEANGREHLGQVGGAPIPHSYDDSQRMGILHPGDGNALGRYVERYVYDEVGNILSMRHRGSDPANPGWTRAYSYEEPSQLDPTALSNRLTSTKIGETIETYSVDGDGWDAHGNLLRMPHLAELRWDFKNQLQMTRRQAVNPSDADGVRHCGERTWYVYDSGGQRVRKVTESAAGQIKDERIYLGGLEIYRRRGPNRIVRETLCIEDDTQPVAIVETRIEGDEPGVPERLVRYQFGNHLGSVALELDHRARVISYEEYTPYGSTAYQAVRTLTESPKRYRYTGKERDEENGLYYHGARYYAPWLGRWLNTDPAGLADGTNLYRYCRDSPIDLADPSGMQPPDPQGYRTFEEFSSAAPSPWSTGYLQSVWNASHPDETANDIVESISEIGNPGAVAEFWANQVRPNRGDWAGPLSELERGYIAAFRDPSTPEALRMRIPVDPTHLTEEEHEATQQLFGTGANAAQQYANYENRRRILAHYVYTHPATVRLELGLYRLIRDVNPIHFALERGWQIGSGQEMFTQQDVSRLGAAGEFLVSLAVVYGVGRVLNAARPTPAFGGPTPGPRALTDPIWDLPQEGGGLQINGRWYSEHALERMAPDTPQVRAELRARTAARLERLGIGPSNPAYDRVMARALGRVDPRGVPPSVVEAEIALPGSTSVRVITARLGQAVVTVIPR